MTIYNTSVKAQQGPSAETETARTFSTRDSSKIKGKIDD